MSFCSVVLYMFLPSQILPLAPLQGASQRGNVLWLAAATRPLPRGDTRDSRARRFDCLRGTRFVRKSSALSGGYVAVYRHVGATAVCTCAFFWAATPYPATCPPGVNKDPLSGQLPACPYRGRDFTHNLLALAHGLPCTLAGTPCMPSLDGYWIKKAGSTRDPARTALL